MILLVFLCLFVGVSTGWCLFRTWKCERLCREVLQPYVLANPDTLAPRGMAPRRRKSKPASEPDPSDDSEASDD